MPPGPASGTARALRRSHEAMEMLASLRLPPPWQREGWCLYRCPEDAMPSAQVASFDFDKTLHFGGPAWRLTSAHIPARFQQLSQQGYKLVVFSNQHGPGRQRTQKRLHDEVHEIIERFDMFASFCGVPLQMFVSTARGDIDDLFRKPNTGMWDLMASPICNKGVLPDVRKSFYVGNSAGRRTDGNDVDREFARRLGLDFKTEDWLRPGGK